MKSSRLNFLFFIASLGAIFFANATVANADTPADENETVQISTTAPAENDIANAPKSEDVIIPNPNPNPAESDAIFVWYHGTSREHAKRILVAELERRGVADEVKWNKYRGSVTIALGIVLSMRGYVSDEAIVIEKSGGTYGDRALTEIRRVLRSLFPTGSGYEQIKSPE